MSGYSRLYVTAAFVTGILLTLGFKDFYPDLERHFQRRKRKGLVVQDGLEKVALTDATVKDVAVLPAPEIGEGIKACIGNTPLIKIPSLSEATGCEILAKAEVDSRVAGLVSLNSLLISFSFSMVQAGVPRTGWL